MFTGKVMFLILNVPLTQIIYCKVKLPGNDIQSTAAFWIKSMFYYACYYYFDFFDASCNMNMKILA